MREGRRRRHGRLPSARRLLDLRGARAAGADVLVALPARRRPGQLRQRRRLRRGCHALHRVPPLAHGRRDAARPRRGRRRLRAELRRAADDPGRPARALPEPARQRRLGHRGRHGDEHPASQPRRGDRRGGRTDRRPRDHDRGSDAARQGPRLPHGCRRDGLPGHQGCVRDRPRAHAHARGGPHRAAEGRPRGDRDHRAALPGQEGRRGRRHPQDRRPRERQGPERHPQHRRPVRQAGHADLDRAEARRDREGRPQQPVQAHAPAVDVRREHGGARRRHAPHARAEGAAPPLRRPPEAGHHAADEVPPRSRRAPRARARGLPDRAREPRRGHRADPRVERCRPRARIPDRALLVQRGAGPGDPRSAPARPHVARDRGDPLGARRADGADRRAARDPRRRGRASSR